jgi:hypothetical protein
MKKKTLLLLSLLFFIPGISMGAELRNLEVQFAFTAPDYPAKQLTGYRLYMDGQQVCTTNDPSISRLTCKIMTQVGTCDFTLTACYSDGSESPPSPSFPFTFDSTPVTPAAVVSPSTTAGNAPLNVVDNQGPSSSATTPIAEAEGTSAGGGATNPGTTDLSNNFNFEVGSLRINNYWVRVLFENNYSQPIVIAGPPTVSGGDPSLVRIRNIGQNGFDIRIQEWDYLDGTHALETVNYVVMEKGVYTLDNGFRIEAGNFDGSTSLQQVSLQQAYNFTPVIMTQVMTETGSDAVANRLSDISQTSFKHKLQEQQSTQTDHSEVETIGYIAMESGMGQIDGLLFEASLAPEKIDHNWFTLTYGANATSQPFFFAGIQTSYGVDTAALRIKNISKTGIQIKIEEEQSEDTETTHIKEVIGYFTIGAVD